MDYITYIVYELISQHLHTDYIPENIFKLFSQYSLRQRYALPLGVCPRQMSYANARSFRIPQYPTWLQIDVYSEDNYHWEQKYYLPNFYSEWTILGSFMCFLVLCAQDKFQGNSYQIT